MLSCGFRGNFKLDPQISFGQPPNLSLPWNTMQASSDLPSNVHTCEHPLLMHKMSILRDRKTQPKDFRSLLHEITLYLGFEATRQLTLNEHEVTTPYGQYHGHKLAEKVAIIPILRAGLGMADSLLELLPNAGVHHIGIYRNKDNLRPVEYYNRLPRNRPADVAFIVDPMIATSGTSNAVIAMLKRWGARKIVLLALVASKSGVTTLAAAHPDVDIFLTEVDEVLSPEGMIIPGLGDAGDRLFSTPEDSDATEEPTPSKRGATTEAGAESTTKSRRKK